MSERVSRTNRVLLLSGIALVWGLLLWLSLPGGVLASLWRHSSLPEIPWLMRRLFQWSAPIILLQLGVRTVFWLLYRPAPPGSPLDVPSVTVVVPAYNEGAGIVAAVESIFRASYPEGRLHVVLVDDGSRDDTWEHIRRMAERWPGRVESLQLTQNQGKRQALVAGFRRARGEIIVTLDSDSVLDESALLAIVGAFRDSRVGAVAGKVTVQNSSGLIPKMLRAYFARAFDFLRAAQSVYRTVYCCPGALSAFRGTVLRQVLERWANQTFLGGVSPPGEDRALTNFILEAGYDAIYQRSAVVRTQVPQSYGKLWRMYARWDRGFFCEELQLLRLVWKRPLAARLITLADMLLTDVQYPLGYFGLGMVAILAPRHPWILALVTGGLLGVSALNLLYCYAIDPSRRSLYSVLYDLFAFFSLSWVFPYACLTMRRKAWGTR